MCCRVRHLAERQPHDSRFERFREKNIFHSECGGKRSRESFFIAYPFGTNDGGGAHPAVVALEVRDPGKLVRNGLLTLDHATLGLAHTLGVLATAAEKKPDSDKVSALFG